MASIDVDSRVPVYPALETHMKNYCSSTKASASAGFTFIELLVVMAILMVLSSIALANYGDIKEIAKRSAQMEELRNIDKMIAGWVIERGSLPDSLNDLKPGGFVDKWGNPIVYGNFATETPRKDVTGINQLNTDYDLYSKGSDGATDEMLSDTSCDDDVLRGASGSFVGLGALY